MKTIAKIALTLALLPVAAFAAEDPVLASFERDLTREAPAHTVRALPGQADPMEQAFRIAMDDQRKPETRAEETAIAGFSHGLGVDPTNEG